MKMAFRRPEILRGPFPERQASLWNLGRLSRLHDEMELEIMAAKKLISSQPDLDNGLVRAHELVVKKHGAAMSSIRGEPNDFRSFEMLKCEILNYSHSFERLEAINLDHRFNLIKKIDSALTDIATYISSEAYTAALPRNRWQRFCDFLSGFYQFAKKSDWKLALDSSDKWASKMREQSNKKKE